MAERNKQVDKEFKLSSWAIQNKTTIYVLMFLILYLGITAYFTMPRENFPEINYRPFRR
jgi:multidrug efflux pump